MLSALLLTLSIAEYITRNYAYSDYAYKHNYMLQNGDKVKTLILGSSHGYQGIDPNVIPSAFNLANSAQPLQYDYELLKHYDSQLVNLENVILTISYFSFRSSFDLLTYDWQKTAYKVYMDVPVYSDFSKYNFIASYMPLFRTVMGSVMRDERQYTCDSLGFKAQSIKERSDEWENSEAKVAIKSHSYTDTTYVHYNIEKLKEIIAFCKERNINLTLITTPTWHAYYENLNPAQLAEMYRIVERLQAEYNFDYYDFLKDKRFTSDDFINADHLNEDGAKKLTEMLLNTIINPRNINEFAK